METAQLASAVRRAVRYTVSAKISYFLAVYVPSLAFRSILTVGASVLLVGLRSEKRRSKIASVSADLALSIASSTLIQGLTMPGADSLPLTVFNLCAILELGGVISPLVLGNLGDPFLGNVQYIFASVVSESLLSLATPTVALAGAVALSAFSSWGAGFDNVLSVSLAQASTAVVKSMLIESIPPGLQLMSITGILCFIRPMYNLLGLGEQVYNFALYQAGGALQAALEQEMAVSTAAVVALAVAIVVPIPVFKIAAQIAAVGSATNWVVVVLQEAADVDPFPSLLSLLLFSTVVLTAASDN